MTKKSYDKELPEKIEYDKLPKDAKKMIDEDAQAIITKESRITLSKKGEFIIRLPKGIAERMHITQDYVAEFTLKMPKPDGEKEPDLTLKLIKK